MLALSIDDYLQAFSPVGSGCAVPNPPSVATIDYITRIDVATVLTEPHFPFFSGSSDVSMCVSVMCAHCARLLVRFVTVRIVRLVGFATLQQSGINNLYK